MPARLASLLLLLVPLFGACGRALEIPDEPTAPERGAIYLFGGARADRGPVDAVDAYDVAADTWRTVATLPRPRATGMAAVWVAGRVYLLGGEAGGVPLASVDVFDPATRTWSSAAPMPRPRLGIAAAAAGDGRIYAFGGWNEDGDVTAIDAYDPDADRWETVPGDARCVAAAPAADGAVDLFRGGSSGPRPLVAVDRYDPATQRITPGDRPPPATLTQFDGRATAGPDGRAYVVGITDGSVNAAAAGLLAYAPDGWPVVATLPTVRTGAAIATTATRVYVVGGGPPGGDEVDTVEAYEPRTGAWTRRAPLPLARALMTAVAVP